MEIRHETVPPQAVRFHEYADLFPWVEGAAYDELRADIREKGVLEPVVFYQGSILDGRNRYMIARDLGIEYPRVDYEGDDPLGFVISKNLQRRHLTESQRASVAARLAKLPRGANQHVEISTPSQGDAARMLNVSRHSVIAARKVHEHGTPELVSALDRGEVAVSAAAQVARLPKNEQAMAVMERRVASAAKQLREAKRFHDEVEAMPDAEPMPEAERQALEKAVGTVEERAHSATLFDIAGEVKDLPEPADLAMRIPPALGYAIDENLHAFEAVAEWFAAFCQAWKTKERADDAA